MICDVCFWEAELIKKATSQSGYKLSITASGPVEFSFLRAGVIKTVTSTTTLPLNAWKNVTTRYDGAELRLFINATKESASTAATGRFVWTDEPLWIGGHNSYFKGVIDDVSIYDTALNDTEVTDLFNRKDKRYEYHHLNALGSNIVLTDDQKPLSTTLDAAKKIAPI